ncbi:MAG: DUF2808 domain-containing protein [Cyanobacteria bacterium P01_F01_bin.42]
MEKRPRIVQKLVALSATVGLSSLCSLSPALGIQLANGKVFFDKVPRLQGATTTSSRTHSLRAKYYFEVDVPADAGEPLKHLKIKQRDGVDRVKFNLSRTSANLSKRKGPEVSIESVSVEEDDQITVSFSEAIEPGNKVFLRLRPHGNPDTAGVYLFGVTALPAGSLVHPQFLGYGRLHFYERQFHSSHSSLGSSFGGVGFFGDRVFGNKGFSRKSFGRKSFGRRYRSYRRGSRFSRFGGRSRRNCRF